jgi:hypothetical protein
VRAAERVLPRNAAVVRWELWIADADCRQIVRLHADDSLVRRLTLRRGDDLIAPSIHPSTTAPARRRARW